MGAGMRGRTRRLLTLAAVVALVVVGLPMVAGSGSSAGAVERLTVCHLGDDGTHQALAVPEKALAAHLGHGDSLPGDPVPGMVGYWFDDACVSFDHPPVVDHQAFSVDENAPDGTVVGTIVVSDPDLPLGDVVTVTVTGGTGQTAFAVDGAGVITVADSSQLDYETTPTFMLAVSAADLAGMTDTATVTIDLNDLPATTVTLAGPYQLDTAEADALEAEFAVLASSEIEVIYEYVDPVDLEDRVTGPNPPDLITVPQPGALADLAPHLVDLADVVDPVALRSDYSDHLIDSVTVDGAILGVPMRADLKSLVWYQPDTFAEFGYQIPQTFTELIALSDQMVADGWWPWCHYMESGFATGWMGSDWVEDLVLTSEGPDVYDQWVDHDVLFTDPRIETAFERYLSLLDTPGYTYDRANLLNQWFLFNAVALGDEECLMHKQASFFAAGIGFFGYDLDDFSTFEFPAVDPAFADAATGAGVYVAAVTDSAAVRKVVQFMVSDQFGTTALADLGGWILPNVRFDTTTYSDEFTRSFAETVQAAILADQFRFDASDLMPPEVTQAFWAGIRDLVDGVKTIPEVLADIDASWPT